MSKNPKFDGMILDDQASDSVTAPKSGSYKLINRNGSLFNVDNTGIESPVGASSAGEVNYISEWDAEIAVTDWNLYKDTAQSTPVDGTGDGGSASITWTRQSSVVLRGTQSYKLTKTAADLEGEGASYDFDIKTQDTNKKLKIQFDYKTDEDANYAAGDLTVYIYDKTNTTLITPTDTDIPRGQNIFQTSFNSTGSTSYRLIFHVADTLSTAWDAYIDHIVVGPGMTSQGAAVGPWESYTPSNTQGFGSITGVNIKWRRVGDSIDIQGYFTSGTTTGDEAQLELPNSLTIATPGSDTVVVGHYWRDADKTSSNTVLATNGDTYLNFGEVTYAAANFLAADPQVGTLTGSSSERKIFFAYGIPVSEYQGKGIVPMLAEDNLSEWQSYTTNISNLTSNIQMTGGQYRRVGESMEVMFSLEFSNTNSDGQFKIDPTNGGLPGGYSIDTTGLDPGFTGGPDEIAIGSYFIRDAGGTFYQGVVMINAGNAEIFLSGSNGNTTFVNPASHPMAVADGDIYTMHFTIPKVSGWTGSQNSLVGYSLATETQTGLVSTGTQSFAGAKVFNEDGADADFRVESDSNTHMLFVDASADSIGINTASPSGTVELHVAGGAYASGGVYIGAVNDNNRFRNVSTGAGSTTMYIGNQSITTSSDKRLKKDIEDSKVDSCFLISKLRFIDFTWDDPSDQCVNNKNSRGRWTSVIAQEAVEHIPTMINAPRKEDGSLDHESEDTWHLDASAGLPLALKAIQELTKQNDELKKRIEALEAK